MDDKWREALDLLIGIHEMLEPYVDIVDRDGPYGIKPAPNFAMQIQSEIHQFMDKFNVRAPANDDGQPDESQEWRDCDPDC